MADQAEVTKSVAYAVTGSDSDECSASKVIAYIIVAPGEGEEETGQGQVHTQILRRS